MSKQFYFEQFRLVLVQFQCKKLFYLKLFRLAQVRSLLVKTILLKVIQFSISPQFSSI